jgi:hypothetical protein
MPWRGTVQHSLQHGKVIYDKLIESFAAFVILATIRIWIRFVLTT